MPAEPVRSQLTGGILTITLDQPETRNAIGARATRLLLEFCRRAAVDSEVRVVMVTGAEGAFCSGGNFKEFGQADPDDVVAMACGAQPRWNDIEVRSQRFQFGSEVTALLHGMGKPTIALIRGAVVGAGIGLAAACDFRMASASSFFQPGYLRLALSPDFGVVFLLTQILGSARTREFLLLRDRVCAAQALQMGLLTEVFADAEVVGQAHAMAQTLAALPPVAVHYTKAAINAAETRPMAEAFELEANGLARCFQTQDFAEAGAARREGRRPLFTGR